MDLHMFVLWLEAILCASLIHAAPVSENFVVSVNADVSVRAKLTATLPCWLSPQQSAEDLEVHWFYADQFDAPVMLYKDKMLNDVSQQASYRGRVSFGFKDTLSGGLKDGDVTLKLINVTLADAGRYTCYVSSDQHHDRASVDLLVTQTGVSPLMTAVVNENNVMNVSCESGGWYPEPQLNWFTGNQAVVPKGLGYSTASSGLVSVHSWVLVSSSSAVACSVGLPGEEAVTGRVRVETHSPQLEGGSGSLVAGWVLFVILLAAALGVLGFLWFKKHRGKRPKSKTQGAEDASDGEPLLNKEWEKRLLSDLAVLDETNDIYVNVELEKTDNKYIIVKGNVFRDVKGSFPDGSNVTCLTAVKGTPGLSSGKHYWEVSLGIISNVAPKKSWWIGVTSYSGILQDMNLSSNVDNGFWFLSSSPDNVGVLRVNTNPAFFLGVDDIPRKIGVYLDYEGGKLAFYNVEKRSLIGSLSAKFTGEVFPLFNPGKYDDAPMEILHRNKDGERSDTRNDTP